jgi:CubicO group peptidase (beta-lactamase class C family)
MRSRPRKDTSKKNFDNPSFRPQIRLLQVPAFVRPSSELRPTSDRNHIGTGPEYDVRVSPMIKSSPYVTPSGTNLLADQGYFNAFITPEIGSSIPWRRAELGGSNGHGNARSVALAQSVLSGGGTVRGVRLLSETGCARALETQADGMDRIFGLPIRWGLGYALDSPMLQKAYGPAIAGHRVAYWGGSGGSAVLSDLDLRMTVAFVMNKHVEAGGWDHRSVEVVQAAYESLSVTARR